MCDDKFNPNESRTFTFKQRKASDGKEVLMLALPDTYQGAETQIKDLNRYEAWASNFAMAVYNDAFTDGRTVGAMAAEHWLETNLKDHPLFEEFKKSLQESITDNEYDPNLGRGLS